MNGYNFESFGLKAQCPLAVDIKVDLHVQQCNSVKHLVVGKRV